MFRSMMGFQILFVLMFFTGMNAEENPVNRCMGMMKFQEELDSILKLAGPERLNLFCTNITSFFTCINDVMLEKTNMTVKELANHWLIRGTEHGKFLNHVVKLEEFAKEICTNGSQLQREYMLDNDCFTSRTAAVEQVKQCKDQAVVAFEMFKEFHEERSVERQTDVCVIPAYQLGCMGAILHDACGEEAFNRYKSFMKRLGFFQSGICSPDIMETLKTTFLENLKLSESQRSLYRTILELKKRRK